MNRRDESPLIYIIVLNWNQAELTLNCLDSLAGISYPNAQVVMVDNGSTDGSVSKAKRQFPELKIIQNNENLGFSLANNKGIEFALLQGAEYVLLLNNDTVVAPDFLTHLIQAAESDPGIGVVAPKIYYFNPPNQIWSAGAHINWKTGRTYHLQKGQNDKGNPDQSNQTVNFVTGCAICVKREVLEKVGLLDPRYFFYYEDSDWCARITHAGFRCVYVPQSKIWHIVSATMGDVSPRMVYYMTRNEILFLYKNSRGIKRIFLLGRAFRDHIRTLLAYTLLPKNRDLKHSRNAIFAGLKDAVTGQYGKQSFH